MSRPEHVAPPDIYYSGEEARKYTTNTRIIKIQGEMAERAYEQQAQENTGGQQQDIGIGSGQSGEVQSDKGHVWIGCDISRSMQEIAIEREVEGDLICSDAGQGQNFRPGVFDGAISISAQQWLCNSDTIEQVPQKRQKRFFISLYSTQIRGGRAVQQFYPENAEQLSLINKASLDAGFSGGVVIDYPNSSKARKYYLVQFAGERVDGKKHIQPAGLDFEPANTINVLHDTINRKKRHKNKRNSQSTKERIGMFKERRRNFGLAVRSDSKYSGRRRKSKF